MLTWSEFLKDEFKQDYFLSLSENLKREYDQKTIYPPKDQVFNAFSYAPYEALKVVLIGQDPYHQVHQAHGVCFSVQEGIKIPPSLQNIFKELKEDMKCPLPSSGSLVQWAKQGVLLLNSILTVEDSHPLSHKDIGWQTFYEHVLTVCDQHPSPIVFILWGKQAQAAQAFIKNPKHLVLKSVHPSPLSAYQGFFGSKPFSQTNTFLIQQNRSPIEWCLK